ncbi:GntR family transcriptional regulator [Mycolicibacterium sp. CBMA 234]|uniref:GntR family transcriptional regulator n=1 Tax=Mycolicibacterium sp. CBMA 234 TaxID=1918495 RepID=UPI0013911DAE|nr:GntR family transcriptional regulator [Mycolicibacterium sp. CBMA 234]
MNLSATTRPGLRRREQLSDEVAAHLRTAIMSGTLLPGTYVRLDETAAALGVSITPIREALRTLRGEGMVQLEPNRGYVVSAFTRDDIADIFWLQATIATEIAASAARRISDAEIDELARIIDDQAAAVAARDTDRVAAAEFMFHKVFNRAAGRTKLAWFLLHAARYLPPRIYAADPDWGAGAVAGHRKVVAALRDKDIDEVVSHTRSLFDDAAQRLTRRLDELGLWTSG